MIALVPRAGKNVGTMQVRRRWQNMSNAIANNSETVLSALGRVRLVN